jgi:hypothetical protein
VRDHTKQNNPRDNGAAKPSLGLSEQMKVQAHEQEENMAAAASTAALPKETPVGELLREEGIDPEHRSVVSPSELAALLECIKVSTLRPTPPRCGALPVAAGRPRAARSDQ